MLFDIDTLDVSAIRVDQRYGGQRARVLALLGTARITVQVDFGFGDAVTPGPEDARLPTLIAGLPEPFLRTYPKVSAIAEKFESMVQLEIRNSRMKDFYDIWALSESFAFDGFELQEAVSAVLNDGALLGRRRFLMLLSRSSIRISTFGPAGQTMDARAGC